MPVPSLPLEIIDEIYRYVSSLDNWRNWKRDGRALSLVNRYSRDVGQALVWCHFEIRRQRIELLSHHFKENSHLSRFVKYLQVTTSYGGGGDPGGRDEVDLSTLRALSTVVSALSNLRWLAVYGRNIPLLLETLRAAVGLRDLTRIEVSIPGKVEWNEEVTRALSRLDRMKSFDFYGQDLHLPRVNAGFQARNGSIRVETLKIGFINGYSRSNFVNRVLSPFNQAAIAEAVLTRSAVSADTVQWLLACQNLVTVSLVVNELELNATFARFIPFLPRFLSLQKGNIFLSATHDDDSAQAPLPLVRLLASFPDSLRKFELKRIQLNDVESVPLRDLPSFPMSSTRYLVCCRAIIPASGRIHYWLIWELQSEGRLFWYRSEVNAELSDANVCFVGV